LKILVLEFATATGLKDPNIFLEGKAMLEAILDDLNGLKVDYLLSKNLRLNYHSSCKPIFLDEDLLDWLENNIINYDACLPIAPEEDFILYKITRIIEEKGVKVIGSNSDAVKICSDKYKLFKALKLELPIIDTERVFFNEIGSYKSYFDDSNKKILKPADGVSCSGVHIVNSFDDFKSSSLNIKTYLPYFIMQDFVEGISSSVSILTDGDKVIPLTLNLQNIHFFEGKIEYIGGLVPFDHDLDYRAKEISKKAVKSIKGLKGYVGIDLILADSVHLVEINPRITTSYIALKHILDFNLSKTLINSVNGIPCHEFTLKGKIKFEKNKNSFLIKEVVS
jgi:tyramine---L-glutamate ligase